MSRILGILLLVALALAPCRAAAVTSTELFFYSPEFAPDNLGVLQRSIEEYLRSYGIPTRFQAFARFDDFKTEFAQRKVGFAILPPWVVDQGCFGRVMMPLARPVRAGKTLDRKAVVVGPTIHSPADLKSASLAVTSARQSGSNVPSLLAPFLEQHPNIRIIAVPKDIDALLAVSFGQVEAAFVSTAQFETLAQINPALTSSLKEIGFAVDSPFPLLYATKHARSEEVDAIIDATSKMGDSDSGQRLLRLLGYDEWQIIPTERRVVGGDWSQCSDSGKEAQQ